MKISLVYDRQYLDDCWRVGGTWSAYQATKLALETMRVEVATRLEDCDFVIFWDCLELAAKYPDYLKEHSRQALVKIGGYFQGDPDLGIPWGMLHAVGAVVMSSPDMVGDAVKRCCARVEWIPDGYDPRIFYPYPANQMGGSIVACCGMDDYRGCGRVLVSGLPVRIVGPMVDRGDAVKVSSAYEGQVPHEAMGDFLRSGYLFLSLVGPSKGFTISRLEAMACGLPMICSDQGWQQLCMGTAKVIPLKRLDADPQFLSKTVAELSLPELRRMRETGLAKAAEFTPDKVGAMWLDLLRSME